MGCAASIDVPSQSKLTVASLNYSGIALSPFEYYSEEFYKTQMDLNKRFLSIKKIMEKQDEQGTQALKQHRQIIRIIDKYTKHKRYSPLYQKKCGIQNRKFLIQEEFYEEWNQKLQELFRYSFNQIEQLNSYLSNNSDSSPQQQIPNLFKTFSSMGETKNNFYSKKGEVSTSSSPLFKLRKLDSFSQFKIKFKKSENQEAFMKALSGLRLFDFICYRAIAYQVYQLDSLKKIKHEKSVLQYYQFYQKFFQTKNIDERKKIQYLKNFMSKNNIDVMFIQDGTKQLRKAIQKDMNYRIILEDKRKANDVSQGTMIFINENSFRKAYYARKGNKKFLQIQNDKYLKDEIKEHLFDFGDVSGISIDNFLFISVNFPSPSQEYYQKGKKDPKIQQRLEKMFLTLRRLKSYFPRKYIVVGGCFYQQISSQQVEKCEQKAEKQISLQMKNLFRIFPSDLQQNKFYKEVQNSKIFTIRAKPTNMQLEVTNPQEFLEYKGVQDYIIFDRFLEINSPQESTSTGIFPIQQTELEKKKTRKDRKKGVLNTPNFYTPNHFHPFDHLAVVVTLKVPQKKILETYQGLNHFDDSVLDELQQSSDEDIDEDEQLVLNVKQQRYQAKITSPLKTNFSFFCDSEINDKM